MDSRKRRRTEEEGDEEPEGSPPPNVAPRSTRKRNRKGNNAAAAAAVAAAPVYGTPPRAAAAMPKVPNANRLRGAKYQREKKLAADNFAAYANATPRTKRRHPRHEVYEHKTLIDESDVALPRGAPHDPYSVEIKTHADWMKDAPPMNTTLTSDPKLWKRRNGKPYVVGGTRRRRHA